MSDHLNKNKENVFKSVNTIIFGENIEATACMMTWWPDTATNDKCLHSHKQQLLNSYALRFHEANAWANISWEFPEGKLSSIPYHLRSFQLQCDSNYFKSNKWEMPNKHTNSHQNCIVRVNINFSVCHRGWTEEKVAISSCILYSNIIRKLQTMAASKPPK